MSGLTESAPRLVLKTFLDTAPDKGPFWIVKVRNYGDGLAEVGWSKVDEVRKPRKGKRGERKPRSEMEPEHLIRSLRRAKANVRRKIMSSGADHLLTLTYRENEEDESKAWADWAKFARKVRANLGKFKHVVIVEKQKRGALHFHAAVLGFQNIKLLRRLWREVVGEGNIDVQYKGHHKGQQWKRARLAAYLCKYISKTFDLDSFTGRHRYRCSQGIEIPESTFYLPACFGMEASFISQLLTEISGKFPAYWWEPDKDEEKYRAIGWACTWC